MSTTTTGKRTWRQAVEDAIAFRALFAGCYEDWEVAGSVRRKRPEVGDVEHVVAPKFGAGAGEGLFGERKPSNLLWTMLDEYVKSGTMTKHVYGTHANGSPMYRWGDRYRGCDFRGFNHEIFCADSANWGAQILIRTGPAEFSQRFVAKLKAGGMYRQGGDGGEDSGYLIHVASGQRVPVPDETTYFKLAGLPWIDPEKRQ